jgi:DNA-binding winged helix-turn-helix (wHTH) protein/Tol biopolymer transport system component
VTEHKCLVFNFADVEVREREFSVIKAGEVLSVEPKAFRVLLFLLRNPHKLITKDQLLDAVWNDISVSENSLTRSIALLRRVLGDDTHEPRYIATVPTIGYRFLCDVQITEDGFARLDTDHPRPPPVIDTSSPANADEQKQRSSGSRKKSTGLLYAGLVAAVFGILLAGSLVRRMVNRRDLVGHAVAHQATEQRVTSNPPDAPIKFAIVSPDGKYVAYTDPTGLYLRQISSGETRPWGVSKDFIASPSSWFPDGTHLLVTRFKGASRIPSLWNLSLLGGSPRMLMDNAAAGAVSPDGSRIAYLPGQNFGSELWLMDSDGANPRKIAATEKPGGPSGSQIWPVVWSPGGQRIAYIESHGLAAPPPAEDSFSLQTRDANGGDLQVVLNDSRLKQALCWAADGRILYAYDDDPISERTDQGVYSIRVDERTGKATGQPQAITTGQGYVGGLSVTSDGKRLVLWRENTQLQAFIAEFEAGSRRLKTPRRLTLDANGNVAEAWTSDSKAVLFVSNRNGTWKLFKQAIDETTAEVLVEGRSLFLPRLSADGSQVLYLSYPQRADSSLPVSLMRKSLAGGPPQLVLQEKGIFNFQCARAPSQLCIFSKLVGTNQIFVSFDIEHGAGREITRKPGSPTNWTLSPNGTKLAIFLDRHRIRFLSLDTGVARDVSIDDWPIDNGDWSADGKSVFIQSVTSKNTPVILDVNEVGKAEAVLEGDANTSFWWMIQSPDGRYGILGAEVPGDNNAWMVENF